MPGRNGNSGGYRYGFNGKEKDDEVKGSGNSYNFGGRSIYDGRLGRFISVDPRWREFLNMSPYCFAANSPIYFIDEDGEGAETPIVVRTNAGTVTVPTGYTLEELLLELRRPFLEPVYPRVSFTGVVLRLALTVGFVLIPSNADRPDRCCNNEMCSYNKPCEKRIGQQVISGLAPLKIYTDNPGTLPDWYLDQVKKRIEDGTADFNDYKYAEEIKNRPAFKTATYEYLRTALLLQDFKVGDVIPQNFKESWSDENYDYEVRIHQPQANAPKGSNSAITTTYRVARRQKGVKPGTNGQGYGWEYLSPDGKWHPTSDLKKAENGDAANNTHVPIPNGTIR